MATPVERFRPTSGVVTGYLGVAMAVAIGVISVVANPDVAGLRILLGAALVGLLIWMFVLRPGATAYDDTLLLRQEVTDISVPLALIDRVLVGQTLTVVVGEERYVCTGIGRSRSPLLGRRRSGASAGPMEGMPGSKSADGGAYVERRITELVRAARSDLGAGAVEQRVQRRWAVPELAGIVVLGGGFVVALLFG